MTKIEDASNQEHLKYYTSEKDHCPEDARI
jgi:hypothetical protein